MTKNDIKLLAEAYNQVLNEGLFDMFKGKKPAEAPASAPAASSTEPEGNYPVIPPNYISLDEIRPSSTGEAYVVRIGGMTVGGILVSQDKDTVTFYNTNLKETVSDGFRYPETDNNFYKKPLAPYNGKQFRGGIEGFKKELLKILNTDDMMSYKKQYEIDAQKEEDAKFARQQAAAQKFRDSRR
jgi:hypothetical protein